MLSAAAFGPSRETARSKSITGDGRFVERLASFGWQLKHKPVAVPCRAQWLRLSAATKRQSAKRREWLKFEQ
jgi:hypothetical protein